MWRTAGLAGLIWSAATACGHTQQDEGDARRGQAFAQRVCAQCHAVRRSQIGSRNPDAPTFPVIAEVPGMTALALTVALQSSHNAMPDLVLEPQDRRDVIAYILSLRPANQR
jgi:mono/diheme cytochrome c family protein